MFVTQTGCDPGSKQVSSDASESPGHRIFFGYTTNYKLSITNFSFAARFNQAASWTNVFLLHKIHFLTADFTEKRHFNLIFNLMYILIISLLFLSSDILYCFSTTALILLTPAATDSSFTILNLPISFVFLTWGPPQNSFE